MAKTVYVDYNNGDNANDGLSWGQAKKTIQGARAATTSGDLVLIAPGVYPNGFYTGFTSGNDSNVMYRRAPTMPGKVIIDFENIIGAYWETPWFAPMYFMDIHFRNMAVDHPAVKIADGNPWFIHCVFYQRDGAANTGNGLQQINSQNNPAAVLNCTFYNLAIGLFYFRANPIYGNYFVNVTTPQQWMVGSIDFNAYPGNTETHGINTSVTDVGLTDPGNENFTLNISDPDWSTFMSSGFQGGSIGAWSNGGIYYHHQVPQLAFFSADQVPTTAQGNPQPGWENEGPSGTSTYISGTPTDVIKNDSNELELDLNAEPLATGGRIRSDVFNIGGGSNLIRSFQFSGFEDGPAGALFDINTTLPQHAEYRSDSSSFAKGDLTPGWSTYQRGDNIGQTGHSYVQMRIEYRTNHTNS